MTRTRASPRPCRALGVVAACFGVIAAVGKVLKTVNLGATMKFGKVIQSIVTQLKGSATRAAGAMALVGLGIGLAMNLASFLIQWLVGERGSATRCRRW